MLRPIALFVVFLSAGCASVFLQSDGFAEKLQTGCADGKACRGLVAEAEARVQRCKPNTLGYIRCDDARADLMLAKSLLKEQEADEARAERERRERGALLEEKRREERQAAQAAARAEEARLAEERQRLHREELQRRAAEQHAREIDRLRYLGKTGREAELEACHDGEAVAGCTEILDKLLEAAGDDSERSSLAQLDQKLRIESSRPKRAPAGSARKSYSGGSGSAASRAVAAPVSSGRVRCRDGTLSPSCSCGRSLRGCCSHHGGVAGCE